MSGEVAEIAETIHKVLLPARQPTFQDCLLLQGTEKCRDSELRGTREGVVYELLILQLRGVKCPASLSLIPYCKMGSCCLPAPLSKVLWRLSEWVF